MKKIYLVFICLVSLFLPFTIHAYEEGISNYYVDMTVKSNGNLHVKELIILNGEFNGFERVINYKNNRLTNFDGSLNAFNGSDIYNGTGINLISIKNLDINSTRNFDLINNSGDEFVKVSSASNGDYGKYTLTKRSNGETYRIYNPSKGREKGFYIEYELVDVGIVHNDIAEVGINIFDELTEYVNVLEMKIHIPNNKELLRGWAHGPLTGEITLEGTDLIKVFASKIEPNNPIDVRFAFDKNILSESSKFSNVDALDKIIEVETVKANEANEKREQARKELELEATNAVTLVIQNPTRNNYNLAATKTDYLPNSEVKTNLQNQLSEVLKIIEEKEHKERVIIYIIFGAWLSGLIFLVIYFYKKYDKEYKSEFNGDYYRDFPANYGPEVLGYLINKKITPNELSASILNLINKKVINVEKIEGKKEDYLFIKNNITENLTSAEDKVLMLLFDGGDKVTLSDFKRRAKSTYTSFISDYDDWKLQATVISRVEEFYENNNKKAWGILYSILGCFIGISFIRIHLNFLFNFIVIISGIIGFIYFITISKRTKKGNNDYHKWMGLKRFLRDFSTFDEKTLPEITLWEKYLVYAVPLGCAKKLSKDMKIKVEEFNYTNTNVDMFDIAYMVHLNNAINRTVINSVQAAYNEKARVEAANSSSSSGGGFGGGFSSGGGSFGGGGGGGRF